MSGSGEQRGIVFYLRVAIKPCGAGANMAVPYLVARWLEMTVYFIKRVINGNRRVKKAGVPRGTAAFSFFRKKCLSLLPI